jgi:DNA mismatch endonuclease (patch repair protein)
MADMHSPATRSYNMSRIKGKDTKPEMLVRRYLHAHGLRYRLHDKNLPGKPDLVLPKYKTVVFVNGCFWHGHKGCRFAALPATRTEFWENKIGRNVANDERKQAALTESGWRVLNVWTCEFKHGREPETLQNLLEEITTDSAMPGQ